MTESQHRQRQILTICSSVATEKLESLPTDLRAWMITQANAHTSLGLRWLLAHCDDGVIWGEYASGQLKLSCDQGAFPVRGGLALRGETLQQARLFGEHAELLLWRRSQVQWNVTLRRDDRGNQAEIIDEGHLLWGYVRDGEIPLRNGGFVQLSEGAQGIVHAPPLGDTTPTEMQRASLKVRHYLGEDDAGVARITHSRLVRLCSGAK